MNTIFLQNQLQPKTIYENNPQMISGESLTLNETKREYLINLTSNQSLSIDESQLSSKANQYGMTFNLTIVSSDHYAINFANCNVQQMEFYRGTSELKFTKNWGSEKWDIDIVTYGGVSPSLSLYDWNLRREFSLNIEAGTSYTTPFFSWMTSFNEINTNKYKVFSGSEVDYYTFSLNPYVLTKVSMHFCNSTMAVPTEIQIYGSNDFKNWTQIYSETDIVEQVSTTIYFTPTVIRPFKHYRFHLAHNGDNSYIYIPPMSMQGIGSELLYSGYVMQFPAISAATNGYDVSINTEDGCSMSDSKTPYGAVNGNYISVTRPNLNTIWKVTYTYPEAVRPCGFLLQKWGSYYDICPAWFAWYGSDDGETWERAIELREIMPMSNSRDDFFDQYPCDFGSSHKYWQFRCYETYAHDTKMGAAMLTPIVPYYQYSEFETIVPIMSSDSQDGYTVSASSTTDGDAYKMYDGDDNSYCGGAISGGSWDTTINMGTAVIIQGIQMRTTSDWNRMPTAFKIQGSNNGSSWTDITTQTPGSNFWEQNAGHVSGSFEFENNTAYQYYRLVVTATAQGSYVRICDLGWTTKIRGNPIDYYIDNIIVPIMTSDSQDGYIASASSYWPNGNPFYAFDRNPGAANKWLTASGTSVNGSWIKIELPTAKSVSSFAIQAPDEAGQQGRVPTVFKIQGSNNDSDWTDLVSVSGISWNSNEIKYWNNTTDTAYKYYKILITAVGSGDYCAIGDWYLYERIFYNN